MSSSDYLVEPGLSNNIIDLLSTIQDRYKKKLRAAQAVSVSPSDTDNLVKLLAKTFKLPPATNVQVTEPEVLPPAPPVIAVPEVTAAVLPPAPPVIIEPEVTSTVLPPAPPVIIEPEVTSAVLPPAPPVEQTPISDSLSTIIDEQEQSDNGEQPSADVFPPTPPIPEPKPLVQLSDNTIEKLVNLLQHVFNKPALTTDSATDSNQILQNEPETLSGEPETLSGETEPLSGETEPLSGEPETLSDGEEEYDDLEDIRQLRDALISAQTQEDEKAKLEELAKQQDELKLAQQQANESEVAANKLKLDTAIVELNNTQLQSNKANEDAQAQLQQLRKASVLQQLAQSKVKLAEYHMGNAKKELELEKQQHAAVLNELNAYKNELTKAKETLVKVQSEGETANTIQLNEAQAAVTSAQTNEQEKAKQLEEKTKELEQAQTKALEQTTALVKAKELEQVQSTALKDAQDKQMEMQAEAKSIAEELKKAQQKLTLVQQLSQTQAQQRYMNIQKTRDLVTRFQSELANSKALEQKTAQELAAANVRSTQLEQQLAQVRADYANAQPSYIQQITDWIKHYVPDFVSAKPEEPTVYKVDENALPPAVKQKMDNNYTYLGRIYMKDDVGKIVQTKYILWNNTTHDYFSYNDPQ
jgi:chemotaxis protein histidine kinase CheA